MITIQKRPLPQDDDGNVTLNRRQFFKKTQRGKIQKIVRERYLRNDISCGILNCQEHEQVSKTDLESGSGLRSNKEIIIIDTNVILHQIDVLEAPFAFTNVVIIGTVLNEVRRRSLPIYSRLQSLIRDSDRNYWIYWNEFSESTATKVIQGESPNDRNDRAIRLAVEWYSKHSKNKIILVSDDVENVKKAKDQNLNAISTKQFIEKLPNSSQLLDLLSSRGGPKEEGSSTLLFESHLQADELNAGIASGQFKSGFFNASPYNYLEATVRGANLEKPILLVGRESMNRAIDGDIVAVKILPKSQWKYEADEVIDEDQEDIGGGDDESEDEGFTKNNNTTLERKEKKDSKDSKRQTQPTGKVVGIIKRNWRSYVAHLDSNALTPSLAAISVIAIPLDRRIPRIRIRTRQAASLIGQKIVVSIDDWIETSKYPEGHFVRSLGIIESKEAEQESLLLEHDIPYRPFSQSILNCLPLEGENWIVPPKNENDPAWKNRKDLRNELICSIDPPGCQDIDDALHAKILSNGNIQVGVHIADVSYFVRSETPMDKEASSRGTTVYLVDRRIDMLPGLLSSNLCSLRPNVERLATSVIWELNKQGEILNVEFFKSVISSKEAFTYQEAQNRKDDKTKKDGLTESIRLLNELAIKLKEKRIKQGALNLASPEVRIHLDSVETTSPIDIEQKQLLETNSLVEEFMLLANISVAEKIYENFPQTAVLRRHISPPEENFETLKSILKKRKGLNLDCSTSKSLAESLDKCIDKDEPTFNTLVRIMATRCMFSAEYFCSGNVGLETFGHYGLACKMYTHFTSPIRRMADILTHRQLAASIGYEPLPFSLYDKSNVESILNLINKRHRSAQQASRASIEFWTGQSIKQKIENSVKLIEEAFVIRVFRNGLAVFVSKFGLEGIITFKKDCEFLNLDEFQIKIDKDISELKQDILIGIFDKCLVEIQVEQDKLTKRSKTKMKLVGKV